MILFIETIICVSATEIFDQPYTELLDIVFQLIYARLLMNTYRLFDKMRIEETEHLFIQLYQVSSHGCLTIYLHGRALSQTL